MYILIFFIILSVLVFVHEMGHFLMAKLAGVKVEEFGFGYPPRAIKLFRTWNTDFTLNWIPFGGFVKILGENYVEETGSNSSLPEAREKRFTEVNKLWQIIILGAGVTFNVLLAWVLFSTTFLIGTVYPVTGEFGNKLQDKSIMVTSLAPAFPAEKAGLKAGDTIVEVSRGDLHAESVNEELTIEAISGFIEVSPEPVSIEVLRGEEAKTFTVTPKENEADGRFLVGIGMDNVGTLKLSFGQALKEGAKSTYDVLLATFSGMYHLFADMFKGESDLSQVTGPVGIVGLVGDAYKLGFVYLLSFTAFISINLAVVNLIPFPALDGGRIVMVIVEAIKRSPVNPKVFNWLNTIGFLLLVGFMLIITFNDIWKLF